MGSPYLKMYKLPDGYTENSDDDIKQQLDDELLPVAEKSELLNDAVLVEGIGYVVDVPLIPVNVNAGRSNYTLDPASAEYQTPVGIDLSLAAIVPSGVMAFRIQRADNSIIPPSGYEIVNGQVHWLMPAPGAGAYVSCYVKEGLPATTWALPYDNTYNGTNESFNKVVVVHDGTREAITPQGLTRAYITTPSGCNNVKATYAYKQAVSNMFCTPHNNLIGEHYRMWPDVFVGTYDYPGDSTDINGTPANVGPVPKFVEPSTYQLNYRDGSIVFPQAIDSTATPVRANYAHLVGVSNVTGQILSVVPNSSGLRYRAGDDDLVYPESHGKKWITRNNEYTPRNVYVGGVLTPTPRSVLPFDTLTVVTHGVTNSN